MTTSEKSLIFKNKLTIQDIESERPDKKALLSFLN